MILSELCEAIVDCEHKTAPTIEDSEYAVIRTPDIGRGRLNIEQARKVTANTYETWTRRATPQEGDLIFAREAPVGNVAIVLEGHKVCLGQRTVLLRPCRTKVSPEFLCYYLLNDETQGRLLAKAAGATVLHLNVADIRALDVPYLPSLEDQKRAAAVLAAYDDLIAANQRRIQLLEDSARLLYREWFVKLRFPGHETMPVTDGVPEGWELKPVSEMMDANPRTPFAKDVNRPFVGMEAISEDSMVIDVSDVRPISGGAKFRNGDTLLARITPCLENGKTGFVQFLEDDEAAASGSTEFIVLRSRTVNPYWIYCLARSDSFREHAINSMVGSDGRQRVNAKCFDQYFTLQPPSEVLQAFEDNVKEMFAQVQSLTEYNRALRQARDMLLPKLMSGALDLSSIAVPKEVEE